MPHTEPALNKTVFMFVYTNAPSDPRVVTSGTTLVQLGYQVKTVGVALYGGKAGYYDVEGMDITILPVVNRLNPLFLWRALWQLVRGRFPVDTSPETGERTRSTALSVLFFNLWLLRLALFAPINIIHCHEHQGMLAAWLLAKLKRIPWIYDAHEATPENRANMGWKAAWAIRVESFFLRRADAVITIGERLARRILQRGARKVIIVGNWKRLEDYDIEPARLQQVTAALDLAHYQAIIVYIGALQPDRDIDPLLEAAAQSPDIGIVVGGRGPFAEKVAQAAVQYGNIRWLGQVPFEDVPLYTMLADALYYCLNADRASSYYVLPNHLFEAFAAAKPLITQRGIGEIGAILETIQAGILLDEVTPETVSDAFTRIQDESFYQTLMQQARIGQKQYNWDVAEQRLSALYHELTDQSKQKKA